MVVGVLMVALALVMLTSMVISAVGTGVFLFSLSTVLSGIVLYTRNNKPFLNRLSTKNSR